ncbi:AAA family ATPase [Facklamia lactis]|uniref:AAA family ATPase n=1 Tax=Facklamia lactis TaxID=2749967 RepID=UPI0018CFE4A1|nr:AAA family ATPase [Facklamia lactis]MBG9979385.1 AAA family ATPase [Facklamia lactis]
MTIIEEIGEDSDKKAFAHKGKEIHKVGDKCAFCGNIYTELRKTELNNYFSLDEMKEITQKLENLRLKIESMVHDLENLEELKNSSFYSFLESKVDNSNQKLNSSKQIILDYLDKLIKALNDKQKDMFAPRNFSINNIPDSLENIIEKINQIIIEHNTFSENFTKEQEDSRKKLRLHYVKKILNDLTTYSFRNGWEGYSNELIKLESLKEKYLEDRKNLQTEINLTIGCEAESDKRDINSLKNQIEELEKSKKELLKSTKNTQYLAEVINKKLKASGKENIQLKACNVENDIECYMIFDENEETREISKVSTGEKNIIAFLYFIGNIKSIEDKSKKVIVFDDPMTSNDDTLQYLMITELQRLYRGSNKIFDREKDIFICMTHNIHFHLNVQPHGSFEDKNGKTKYDKNYFYLIRNGKFNRITSEKDDFKTSYESLWIELNDLYENNYLNSMLNSMRRIVETFIKFNRIHQKNFYKEKEEHLKIFNVNSHEAIEEISAEAIGKSKEQLATMFKELFASNGYETHFQTYWNH